MVRARETLVQVAGHGRLRQQASQVTQVEKRTPQINAWKSWLPWRHYEHMWITKAQLKFDPTQRMSFTASATRGMLVGKSAVGRTHNANPLQTGTCGNRLLKWC
jgi:hypothetical protein